MKDSEFIELLNLYLDHEISGPDALRLETEVQNNPARRRIYEDYCRMQKACKLVAADFANETVATPQKKVVPFNPAAASAHGSRVGGFYVIGAFAAAAACVAVIFVGRSRQEANQLAATEAVVRPAAEQSVVAVPAPAHVAETKMTAVAIDAGAPRAVRSEASPSQSVLVSNPLLLTSDHTDTLLANTAPQTNAQFEWIRSVQIAPLPQRVSADTLRFDVRPMTLRPEGQGRQLGGRAQAETTEMSAFEFRK